MRHAWVRYKNIFMNLKSDFLAAYGAIMIV